MNYALDDIKKRQLDDEIKKKDIELFEYYKNIKKKTSTNRYLSDVLEDGFVSERDKSHCITATYYKVRVSDILSTKRDKKSTLPRHMAMALCKDLTNNSLPSIGDGFGGRDHTTVLHANKKVNKLRKDDAHIDQDYNNIVQILNNG